MIYTIANELVVPSVLLVLHLVLKVLGVPKDEGVKVVPEAVEDPEPHDPAEAVGESLVPRGGVVDRDALEGLALSAGRSVRPRRRGRGPEGRWGDLRP
eukprot:CAMPEP_0197503216 /NCGR_PEP_ID=MMETSP1312-20131121/2455_1 /TAXON_ID=464262 /ORGANISM="Genus nov. species nov., Strain RCC2335" /LENGTH=97 /DNA_ID=CAMNT_0043049805 /DNA_START=219 /DNA_END=510 /DNA_ORIENTATION=+